MTRPYDLDALERVAREAAEAVERCEEVPFSYGVYFYPKAVLSLISRLRAVEEERDGLRERTSVSVTVGGGLAVYGAHEAIKRVQDYILLDSQHPVEKEDVRRSLAKALQAAEARALAEKERAERAEGALRGACASLRAVARILENAGPWPKTAAKVIIETEGFENVLAAVAEPRGETGA